MKMQPPLEIRNHRIGRNQPVFIIAEAGVNHNGDPQLARKLITRAKECGADAIKFQTFKAEQVVTVKAPKAEYQLHTTDLAESQLDMLQRLELARECYPELLQLCEELDLVFLSTPYSIDDVEFLDRLGVPAFKIASGQVVEHHFLTQLAARGKPLLLSTGMCTLAEVAAAVDVIRAAGNQDLVVLQCTTNYPSAMADCNLRAMNTMGRSFGLPTGYSDHTPGLVAAIVAVSLGAAVIEKHFTLDKTLPGPDQSSSADPEEFSQLVNQIRAAELCLGSHYKYPTASERKNIAGMRRSLVAATGIPEGTTLDWDNLTFKRPATGITGDRANMIVGRTSRRAIAPDTIIAVDMVK